MFILLVNSAFYCAPDNEHNIYTGNIGNEEIRKMTAFAGLVQYPISIEIGGSQIMIENEESMINTYDRLMEQNGFRQQVENIYTKFMFAIRENRSNPRFVLRQF